MQNYFKGIAAIGAPDGRHIGGQWFHRAGPGARSVDSSADSPGRTARFGIGSVHVQQPAELFSSRRLLARDISGKLILIEYLPNGRKKSRQFLRELRLAFGLIRERHQLLADEVVERALGAEVPPDSLRCSTLLDPDLLESHCALL